VDIPFAGAIHGISKESQCRELSGDHLFTLTKRKKEKKREREKERKKETI
jgi:hypothetical protein